MSCPSCAPAPEACVTVYPTLNPCQCDSPGGIEEIGPTGNTGPKGETPVVSVGTVGAGTAFIEVVETGYATRSINWVLPAIPEDVPYTWSEIQTYSQKAQFEAGLVTTGGESTFGGISLLVSPNATFVGDLAIEGNSTIEGDLSITTHLNETGNLTVQGDTTFDNVEFFEQVDLQNVEMDLVDLSEYPGGILVLGSCLNLQRQPNVGRGNFIAGHGASLAVINPSNVGAICSTIVVNVPVSACLPQVTPLLDIRVRVGYRFGPAPGTSGNFNATLWQGSIGGTSLDFYTQGDGSFNSAAGFFELRARATLVAGNNNFFIEVENQDVTEPWTPSDVDYTMEN